jgi:hypothetical protein
VGGKQVHVNEVRERSASTHHGILEAVWRIEGRDAAGELLVDSEVPALPGHFVAGAEQSGGHARDGAFAGPRR